jgi:hypothetical protein
MVQGQATYNINPYYPLDYETDGQTRWRWIREYERQEAIEAAAASRAREISAEKLSRIAQEAR